MQIYKISLSTSSSLNDRRLLLSQSNFPAESTFHLFSSKEARLERADFDLQLSMFENEKGGRENVYYFLSFQFCQLLSPPF